MLDWVLALFFISLRRWKIRIFEKYNIFTHLRRETEPIHCSKSEKKKKRKIINPPKHTELLIFLMNTVYRV